MSDARELADFLQARLAEEQSLAEYGCPGAGEYSQCGEISERFEGDWNARRNIIPLAWAYSDEDNRAGNLARDVLRHLGAAYASHPDYREEWRQ